jgi:hypothetical protein
MNTDSMPRHREWLRRYGEGAGFAGGSCGLMLETTPTTPPGSSLLADEGLRRMRRPSGTA